ncbi:hypothetical protein [Endothiovibrio diazotrophicus]
MGWLRTFWEKSEYPKQELFARAVGVGPKTVQRWDSHETETPAARWFARMAKVLAVDEAVLREAHEESLKAFRSARRADEMKAQRAACEVDHRPLERALAAIDHRRFYDLLFEGLSRLGDRQPVDDLTTAARLMAELIAREQHGTLLRPLGRAIDDFLAGATRADMSALRALRNLFPEILLASSIPLPSLQDEERKGDEVCHGVKGVAYRHTLIFAIDRSLGSRGRQRLKPFNENELDDRPDVTLCVDLDDCGEEEDDPKAWAHAFVQAIGELNGGLSIECPQYHEPNSEARFLQYCGLLDDVLGARNLEDHYYIFARVRGRVPSGVLGYLHDWLSNLYLFQIHPSDVKQCEVMRGNVGVLSAWMARGTWRVNERLRELGDGTTEEPGGDGGGSSGDGGGDPPDGGDAGGSGTSAGIMQTVVKTSEHAAALSKNVKSVVRDWVPRWPADD